ncbi:Cystathionine gamma-synthase [Marasmius sp. AFHP31]|nr:Cystathionine gamma-synthase [Marasmius sp. AFHP31]
MLEASTKPTTPTPAALALLSDAQTSPQLQKLRFPLSYAEIVANSSTKVFSGASNVMGVTRFVWLALEILVDPSNQKPSGISSSSPPAPSVIKQISRPKYITPQLYEPRRLNDVAYGGLFSVTPATLVASEAFLRQLGLR